ncbi:uncharacterized protein N7498_010195 [Penicillium cinerascens]|uniref:Uncharacterized protein n=1 Tax=Penicillium cinerascens TaxID=70096 RepID=A0A9W9J6G3_9EURO|nr:uncharacterized protein N7498_010195 [Penicillium cinerascens]KAJ5191210.1 hypothetical protein N7498_010195 [Penicillium cinerascens]
MSPGLSQTSNSLHSDASQGPHETVASPPKSTSPVISSENQSTILPSHRRANTEYVARPPIFEENYDYPRDRDNPPEPLLDRHIPQKEVRSQGKDPVGLVPRQIRSG